MTYESVVELFNERAGNIPLGMLVTRPYPSIEFRLVLCAIPARFGRLGFRCSAVRSRIACGHSSRIIKEHA